MGEDDSHSPFFDVYSPTFIDDLLEYYFVLFIEAGGSYSDFENMTLAEIKMFVDGYNNRLSTQRRINADRDYRLALLISSNIGGLLSKKAKPIKFDEMYGDYFEDKEENNQQNNDNSDENEAVLMAHLIQMEQFVNRHNAKFNKKGREKINE